MTRGGPLKEAGFFETADDVAATSRSAAPEWASSAVRYLEQGQIFLASSGWEDDLLDEWAGPIAQVALRTDGEWIWPNSLAHYVTKYHVELPAEFLARMAVHDWVAPELGQDAVDQVCRRHREQQGFEDAAPVDF
ncbi:hypothetical protein SAMN04488074_116111 [Lentzea albidocapillata subsp. violacea]|uniref:Uncharacterized protein n=1 Tax=Lentzea albidocapillata subsp. violacea TaxID=128104 RepID=A0A1G9QEI4_9PSEU|nr:hypothetical protein [Lentzea albidocapillata]SDM08877.1 hypothetical protein SAMN04488074_116111 [Lentzea albidocapillata subsp. violacea]